MEQKRKIVPPVYFFAALVLMATLHFLAPLARFIEAPYSYLGFGLLLGGLGIAGTAVRAFSKAGTPLVPFERSTALVTHGAYRFTRNPMYLGMVLVLIGVALLFGTLSTLLPIPAFIWIIQSNFIRGEERFLEEIFGDRYLNYKRCVRRWI
ncbi:MAG TPA: isoprenylcysteine carboxylmethyltransferase family protein [Burkholderiaceae bacterium]|nr:isoprenylcysteine carboxylmethyltransferase family protein [Burkholderiaceae bacterium]